TTPSGLLKEPASYTAVGAKLNTWLTTPTGPPPFVPTNPDFDPLFESDMLQVPTTGKTMIYGAGFQPQSKQISPGQNKFVVNFPYVEREFYFTTDHSPSSINGTGASTTTTATTTQRYEYDFTNFRLDPNRTKLNIRIPDRSIKIGPLTAL